MIFLEERYNLRSIRKDANHKEVYHLPLVSLIVNLLD